MIPAALAEAVEAAEAAPIDRAVALIRPFLSDIGWFDALLAEGIQAMADDPRHLPGFRASRQRAARHLVLARTQRIWLTASLLDGGQAPSERVHFSGRVSLCRPLNGPLAGDAWRLEGERAVMVGARSCAAGTTIELDERREALCLRPTQAPLMLLRAQVAPTGPVQARIHDRRDGRAIDSAQADEGHARALMLLSLLRLQGRRDAADQFVQALDAPLPGQRWAVMREYLALDTARALPALRAMAGRESDAVVRGLAVKTLCQVGGASCPA
ncbi:HEAT repeat domain-containing protein [Sphingobium sp. Z007]|uniref:HEAT repeat domain-containing protein n=1 Tax=Sphingobium sp. Z007 TaxID=627495 RepID=UPI0020CDC87F|nr:HEAT repeat domain-containing protein [Sphingobium sp. Z007]